MLKARTLAKKILQYAAAMGIIPDLELTGNRFSNVATFLYVGLLCFEVPNGMSYSTSEGHNCPIFYKIHNTP